MSTYLSLQAIVKAPWYEGEPLWPWSVGEYELFSPIRLYAEMTAQDVGAIFAQLVSYNDIENNGEAKDVLHRVIESETLVLPGGIQVKSSTGQLISPGCCCGLEGWREWLNLLTTEQTPWLGHDRTRQK